MRMVGQSAAARSRSTVRGGRESQGETDADGALSFFWDDSWIDRVEVDGNVVQRDISLFGWLGDNSDIDIRVPARS